MAAAPETQVRPSREALKHARRRARREKLRAHYEQPLTTFGRRLTAWLSMLFVDHGVFRLFYLNRHRVGRHAFRSAQPAPHHIRRMARNGVKTVINLRGGREFGSYPLEREACAAHGVAFEEVVLRSREAPTVETIESVKELLDRIERPVLFHCKSGADRAGLMAALYLLLCEDATPQEAQAQLALRYGHFRESRTGVLDAVIDAYAEAEAAARARGETLDFMDWVRRDYDRDAVTRSFKEESWASFLVDRVLARE